MGVALLLAGAARLAGQDAPAAATTSGSAVATGIPVDPASVSNELVAGKVAEEGDADPTRALQHYEGIVARYDAVREAAAEALLRIGEIRRIQGDLAAAVEAYQRVVSSVDCEPQTKIAGAKALHKLKPAAVGAGAGTTAPYGDGSGEGSGSSGESATSEGGEAENGTLPGGGGGTARISAAPQPGAQGLPSGATAANLYNMSPELARRYGLVPSGGAAATGAAGAGGMVTATTGLPPELRRRYGLDSADPITSTAARPATSTSSQRSGRAAEAQMTLDSVRAEALRVNSELRSVQREIRASEGGSLELIPKRMIQDDMLLHLLGDWESSKLIAIKAPESKRAEAVATCERAQAAAEQHFRNVYLPRLSTTHRILEREMELLKKEINEAAAEVEKARVKF